MFTTYFTVGSMDTLHTLDASCQDVKIILVKVKDHLGSSGGTLKNLLIQYLKIRSMHTYHV